MNDEKVRQTIAERHERPDIKQIGLKALIAEVAPTGEPKNRSFTATITSDRLDRDDEVLLPLGMDPTEFLTSRTIFWNHNYSMPIGSSLKLTKSERSWTSDAFIASRPDDYVGDYFPDFVWSLIDQGIIKGVSVGFDSVEVRRPTPADIERWGERIKAVHSKWKLLEWSIAPLQANTDSLITAVHKGLIGRDLAGKVFPEINLEKKVVISLHGIKMDFRPMQYANIAANAANKAIKRQRGQLYE